MTGSIATRAMLVRVKIKRFSGSKSDKKVSKEVATAHNSDETMGRYAKHVIPKEYLDPITSLAGEIRQEHYRMTLPWNDDGQRILSNLGYGKYQDFMRASEQRWNDAVDDFIRKWPEAVDKARVQLNGLFNPADYPDISALRGKFEFGWGVDPLPTAEDFRVDLGNHEVEAIRQQIEANGQAQVRQAVSDAWNQMRDVVAKMVESLKRFDPNDRKRTTFHSTLVGNIGDLLAVLPSFNLTEDPEMDAAIERMKVLTRFSADELKENTWKRSEVLADAERILNHVTQFAA